MGMENKELVYLFLYNPMVYTAGWVTQSVHKNRKSAINAMEKHKAMAMDKWSRDFQSQTERSNHPFGKFEDWRISTMVLES